MERAEKAARERWGQAFRGFLLIPSQKGHGCAHAKLFLGGSPCLSLRGDHKCTGWLSARPGITMSTPNDHQSALCVCPRRFTTSGAMYSMVPQNEYALLSWSMASLLSPKSRQKAECPSGSERRWAEPRPRRVGIAVQILPAGIPLTTGSEPRSPPGPGGPQVTSSRNLPTEEHLVHQDSVLCGGEGLFLTGGSRSVGAKAAGCRGHRHLVSILEHQPCNVHPLHEQLSRPPSLQQCASVPRRRTQRTPWL